MLGERAHEQRQLDRAEELLRGSVAAVAVAGQSRVLVSALEALAAVVCARGRPRRAAVLLGTADIARDSASAHMRPIQEPDQELRRSLASMLGRAAFDAAYGEGQRLSPAQALQAVSSDQRDSSWSALELRHFGAAPVMCRPTVTDLVFRRR
jgi:hypothetical protein